MAALRILRTHRLRLPLVSPFTTAVRSATELETVLIEAVDDDGRSGWGEAPISKVTRASTDAVVSCVQGPLSALAFGDPSIDAVLAPLQASPELPAARTAVDCALHDLAAQQHGVPLVREWDDALARSILADNVELDFSMAERRERLPAELAVSGPVRPLAGTAGSSPTAARLEWTMPTARGVCAVPSR